MKRQTNRQKKLDWADAIKCLKAEALPKRQGSRRADGGIPTHPRYPSNQPESEVLAECLSLLKSRGIKVDRQNNGCHHDISGWHRYGITGSGDILGLMPNGRHLEVECKAGKGGVLSVEQQKRMCSIRENNGLYLIVHSVKELTEELERVNDGICETDTGELFG